MAQQRNPLPSEMQEIVTRAMETGRFDLHHVKAILRVIFERRVAEEKGIDLPGTLQDLLEEMLSTIAQLFCYTNRAQPNPLMAPEDYFQLATRVLGDYLGNQILQYDESAEWGARPSPGRPALRRMVLQEFREAVKGSSTYTR